MRTLNDILKENNIYFDKSLVGVLQKYVDEAIIEHEKNNVIAHVVADDKDGKEVVVTLRTPLIAPRLSPKPQT